MNTSDTDHYDVYYTLYGKEQATNDCSQCLSSVTPYTKLIDRDCVGNNYNCYLKFALKSIITQFVDMNNNIGEYMDKYSETDTYDITLFNTNTTYINNGNLYGCTSSIDPEYDYLNGEWILSTSIGLHNDIPVWTKYDKYRRHLKLFLYDNNESKRWIVGHNLSSDAAYIYSPLPYIHETMQNMVNPINVIHNQWLYHNNTIKIWKPLKQFRFSPSSFFKPQLQSISLKNNTIIDLDKKIILTFTHFIEINDYGQIVIKYINNNNNNNNNIIINGCDKKYIKIIDDKIYISNLTNLLPYNETFSLSLLSNLAYSIPKTPNNGNNYYDNIIYFKTIKQKINWNEIAVQYITEYINHLDDNIDNIDNNIFISLINSLLYINIDHNKFNNNINNMSSYLAIKKQLIINKNESNEYINNRQLQLLKSHYYLKLSQINLLKGYNYLLLNDKINSKKYVDKSLKICIKQYYGSKFYTLINKQKYNQYYCNFNTFDTYNYLLNNNENNMDKYNINYFINTIKLRWIIREYLYKFSNDISILFTTTTKTTTNNLNNKIQFESCYPPRYDILFGLRNLNNIRLNFAKFGVVQINNLLNLIECKWLTNHYTQNNFRSTNDRISYVYLQEFTEIMSYLIGHNVKKSYSMFIDFNNTNFYINNIAQTLREDNVYSILLTINQDNDYSFPFPIYFHKQVVPSQKKQFHFTNYKQNYEFINNVGDAILFKGTQHIHFAPYTKTIQAQNYWCILFQYLL